MSSQTYTLNIKPILLNTAGRPRTEATAPVDDSKRRKFAFG